MVRNWKQLSAAAIICAIALALPGSPARAEATIVWQVQNPFRLFTDPSDSDRHRRAYQELTEAERTNPILSIERRLSQDSPMGWAAQVVERTCWDSERNRHRCGVRPHYPTPRAHRVVARLEGAAVDGPAQCDWWILKPARAASKWPRSQQRDCSEPVLLEIPYPTGATIGVYRDERRIAETRLQVRDLFVVGIGDSFGSGEGNPDVPVRFARDRAATYGRFGKDRFLDGYPARVGGWETIGDRAFIDNKAVWLDQACHRSLYSHQLRVALQLAIEDPHRAVTFVGLACSGAEITKGIFLRYKGNEWVPTPPDLSQISAAAQAQCGAREAPARDYPETYHMRGRVPDLKGGLILRRCPRSRARRIDLLLVSIGGNDIGFARLVANAVLRDRTVLKQLGGWFGQVYRKSDAAAPLAELTHRYKALRRAIHNVLHIPWKEADRIILTAYPRMALMGDGKTVCPSGRLGMEVMPAYALDEERARDGEDIATQLNTVMRRAAGQLGWRYAENHRDAFLGRGICAGVTLANVQPVDDLRFPFKREGQWYPFNPADYRPYASRKRWFRTPNDAFLTGNFHVTGTILRRVLRQESLKWTQVLLASTYSGAFHPTAEGHAAIADSVATEARKVLARYAAAHR